LPVQERWEILSTERGTLAYNKYTKMDCVPPKSDSIAGSFYESDPMYHPLFKDGKILPLGEKYYRPEYARTLELIAEKGADAFYHGEVAEGTIKVVQERGGLLSMDDLKSESIILRQPRAMLQPSKAD
jgi:gamma-glutamyltranspeptidase/glutathione hydrolase